MSGENVKRDRVDVPNNKNKKDKYFGSVKFFKNMIALIILIVIFALIFGLVYMLFFQKSETDIPKSMLTGEVVNGRGVVITPDNIDDIRAQIDSPVADGYYSAEMNFEWTFEKWDKPSDDAYIINSVDNVRTVYFDLILNETEELIYSSPYMPVGSKLTDFALEKELSKGEHKAVVTYHLVDDEFNNITEVSIAVLLRILG